MAGALLQTFTIPRASSIPTASLVPIGTSSPSGCRRSAKLPNFKGLKMQSDSISRNPRCLARRRTVGRKPGSIVCENPQETAVIVPGVTDEDWESNVLGSETTVLVEFWAPWCGPCKMIHPVIDELAKQYAGKLKCFKVNTDESPLIATRYGIRSIPTVILFKSGEKKDTIIGAVPKSTLTTSIDKLL